MTTLMNIEHKGYVAEVVVERDIELEDDFLQKCDGDDRKWMFYRITVTTPSGVKLTESCGAYDSEQYALEEGQLAALRIINEHIKHYG